MGKKHLVAALAAGAVVASGLIFTTGHGCAATDASACPTPSFGGGVQVWLTTTGNDSTCARSDITKPCLTPSKAWSIANSGDTISVANGNYASSCTLSGNKTSTTTFIGSSTTNVKFVCAVTVPVNYAAFTSIGMQSANVSGSNDTFTNVDITCTDSAPYTLYTPDNLCSSAIFINGANFTFTGGSVGPSYDSSDCGGSGPYSDIGTSNNRPSGTIKDVYWHDARRGTCSAQHTEQLRIDCGSNITLDHNTFSGNGSTAAVFISTNGCTAVQDNLVFQNNICDGTGLNGICIDFNPDASPGPPTNVKIRNNTLLGGLVITGGFTYTGMVVSNTIWRGANPCPSGSGVTYSHNAPYQPVTGGTTDQCGSDTNQVGVGTQSSNAGTPTTWLVCGAACASGTVLTTNYHVAASSPLINVGSSTAGQFSTLDVDGFTRPCGAAPEIGAYEYGC